MRLFTSFIVVLGSGALSVPVNKTLDAKDILSPLPMNTTLALVATNVNATAGTHMGNTEVAVDVAARNMNEYEEQKKTVVTRDTVAIMNTTVSQPAARAMNINMTTSGVVAGASNITTSASEIKGMSKEQFEHYRTLAMAQAHEHFERNVDVSASSLMATNSTPPVPGECLINGPCPFLGGDGLCNNFCQKCAPPGKQGQGKCEGFLFILSCTCTFE